MSAASNAQRKAERDPGGYRKGPDIIRAAVNNDVVELIDALNEGQTLETLDHETGLAALHLACMRSSNEFLEEALNRRIVDPWRRDWNSRLPIDHLIIKRNFSMAIRFEQVMYDGVPLPRLSQA